MQTTKLIKNKFFRSGLAAAIILLIPFIGMNVSSEFDWSLSDFIIMGVLVFGTATVFQVAVNKFKDGNSKILVGAAVIGLFLYIWAELAVGIFTNIGS